ncbi:hypothetical protein [Limnobacter sp.]|uniref:hypothetical protein n=1 Tax=Limnobacter sp. TaxID=2003368 RepID=UPI003511DEE0
MSHAICAQHFTDAHAGDVIPLINRALENAKLRRHSDYISRVMLLCTPHYANLVEDMAHHCVAKTNCMNVWGGCASGLLGQGQIFFDQPAIVLALFGESFEPRSDNDHITLCLTENEQALLNHAQLDAVEPDSALLPANTLGLLSYGANYAKMPRIEHGRMCEDDLCSTTLRVCSPMVFNSEGLSFFTDVQTVTESNGLFLIGVDGKQAALALNCPNQQTRPVGLRLQLIHEKGESWIPVMEIHPDGTLGLAAPVGRGQKVRLARRTQQAIDQELLKWQHSVEGTFGSKAPELGVLFTGFERSQLCHEHDNDIAHLLKAFPNTEWLGVFGQAAWLSQSDHIITPPRNNRLSVCLFDTPA